MPCRASGVRSHWDLRVYVDANFDEVLHAGASPGTSTGWAPRRRPSTATRTKYIPGERRYRDGDRVRHARWGDGIVVTSKLTRDDEEVTVVFRDPNVGRKTMLASLANLEPLG